VARKAKLKNASGDIRNFKERTLGNTARVLVTGAVASSVIISFLFFRPKAIG
jgi:hypothetical protein